jgi:GNAT superfamily N-acetyltransferase
VGAALLDAANDWARSRHATAVRLDVTVDIGAAERLYRRMGFVDVGGPVPMAGRDTFEQAMVLPLGS